MADEIIDIPEHADKLLFAEDLVSEILSNILLSPYYGQKAAPYRQFIHNAFNDNVRKAVSFLFLQFDSANTFLDWAEALEESDRTIFLSIAVSRQSMHFSEGFDITLFLYFSIEMCILARRFRYNGLLEAPDLAVKMIFDSLPKGDMHSGVWDAVNVTAAKFAKLRDDIMDIMTPMSVFSEMSDSENQILFHQNSNSDKNSDMMTPISGSPVTSDSETQNVSHRHSNSEKDSDMMTPISGSPAASDSEIDIMSHARSSSDKDSVMMTPPSVSPDMSDSEIQYESYQYSDSDKGSDISTHYDGEADSISLDIKGVKSNVQSSGAVYAVTGGIQAENIILHPTLSGNNNLEHLTYHEPSENITESSIKQENDKNKNILREAVVAQQGNEDTICQVSYPLKNELKILRSEFEEGMKSMKGSSKVKMSEFENRAFRNQYISSIDKKSSSKTFRESSALTTDEKEYVGSPDSYETD